MRYANSSQSAAFSSSASFVHTCALFCSHVCTQPVSVTFTVPLYGALHVNGLTAPGWVMFLAWLFYALLALACFSEPQRLYNPLLSSKATKKPFFDSLQVSREKRSERKRGDRKRSERKGNERKRSERKRSERKRSEGKEAKRRKGSEAKGSEAKRKEAKRSERKRSERKRSEAKRKEANGSEAKRKEAKGSERKGSDAKGDPNKHAKRCQKAFQQNDRYSSAFRPICNWGSVLELY